MTTLAVRTTLLLAAILYGCDGEEVGTLPFLTDFVCPDFAGLSTSGCNALTAVDNTYIRDIRGVHYYVAYSANTAGRFCGYADFEPACGSDCFEKLFGYVFVTLYNSTATAYNNAIKAYWIQKSYGRDRSQVVNSAITADDVIIAKTNDGFVWCRCAPYNSPSAAPVCAILTKERHPSAAVVDELKQMALAAGFTGSFETVGQVNCPLAVCRRGPFVLTLDSPFIW